MITDKTKMYCPKCGEIVDAGNANTIYHPPTWGYYGGSPAEYEIKCPYCGEELEVVESFCEACGEPIVKEYDGYFESSGHFCDECESDLKKYLEEVVKKVSEEFGLPWNKAAEILFEAAEENNWMQKEEKK